MINSLKTLDLVQFTEKFSGIIYLKIYDLSKLLAAKRLNLYVKVKTSYESTKNTMMHREAWLIKIALNKPFSRIYVRCEENCELLSKG